MIRFPTYYCLVFIIALLTIDTAAAQQNNPDPALTFHEFIAPGSFEDSPVLQNNNYLVCCASLKNIQPFINDSLAILLRQLSDSVFIISSRKKINFPDNKSGIRWLGRANANWKMSPLLLQQKMSAIFYFLPLFLFLCILPPALIKEAKKATG